MSAPKLPRRVSAKALAQAQGSALGSGLDAMQVLTQINEGYAQYARVREEEKTKRRHIEADERKAIAAITAQRELLMAYLSQSFDERSANFKRLFEALDKAIENNATELVAATLRSITELAASGPFKDITSVRTMLSDESTVEI